MENKLDEFKEQVEEMTQEAKEAVAKLRKQAVEMAEEVQQSVSELKQTIAEEIEEAKGQIHDITEGVVSKTEHAKDHASQIISQADRNISDMKESVADKAGEIKEQTRELVHDAIDKAQDIKEDISAKAAFVVSEVKNAAAAVAQTVKTIRDRKIIELRGVSIYHTRSFGGVVRRRKGEDELVLSEVNFSVEPGEMVYLIGRVGSGKSTLLKTLYAEVPLFEGEGAVVGYDLRKLKRKDVPYLRRKIGVVFQDYQLLTDRNVFQNLHYVMSATGWNDERQKRKRIEEVLGLVDLNNKEYKMPFELSGGEQQRLSIARALINHPQVILADEPTGNLDPSAAEDIMSLFRQIVGTGCSIVMSTHNITNIQSYPSRTIRLNHGHMEEIDINAILGISE